MVVNSQRIFIQELIDIDKRLDGRTKDEYRHINITFGAERGSCQVTFGNTRVLSSISCHITTPAMASTSEGKLKIEVISPFTNNALEYDKRNSVEVRRVLEKVFKSNNTLNLESLCLIAEEKVWQIQLNVHLLNDDGNIIDCAYLASYIAFHHFRLPQSSLSGTDLIIYPSDERQPIPLSFNHSPHLISWLIFPSHNPRNPGSFVIDGTAIERSNCTAQLTLAVNLYKELCYFKVQNINPDGNVDGNSSGSSNRMHCGYRIDKHVITQYSLKAYEKAKLFEDMVTSALQKENTLRDDWHGSSEESELMKRWVERNFSVDINKSTLENSFNNSCNLDPSLNNVKNEEKVKSIGKPIKSKYINAWFSDIPDLKCLEEKDEKKRNKLDRSNRGKETNKKSVSDKGNTEPDEANDIVLIKGLNFRIGQIDESENSEEEAIMMELGDSELEEKYKPKSSHKNNIKKKARKKKDEDE